ncbi:MAG: gene transfer agent family protein [Pseudomonadota bacterium]
MANAPRGEIEATFSGKTYRLCLTLGALAQLEEKFQVDDMLALAERFENGRLKSHDAIRILTAGLQGAGYDISETEVETFQVEGGAVGFVKIVADLLSATFNDDAAGSELNP